MNGRSTTALLALVVLALVASPVLAAGPRVMAPSIHGPEVVLADVAYAYSGTLTTSVRASSAALTLTHEEAGREIEVLVDGEVAARTTTDAEGRYQVRLAFPRGAHEVRARLANDGASAADSDPLFVTSAVPPSPPRDVRLEAGPMSDEITLRWTPPIDDGGLPIRAYFWEASPWPWFARHEGSNAVVLLGSTAQPYTFRVRAASAYELGESAPSDPWIGVPTPVAPHDAIDLRFDHFRICAAQVPVGDLTGTCQDAAPGSVAFLPFAHWNAWAVFAGSVTDADVGAPDAAVGIRVVMTGGTPYARTGSTTDAVGAFAAEAWTGFGDLGAGRCADLAFDAWAETSGARDDEATTLRLCYPAGA